MMVATARAIVGLLALAALGATASAQAEDDHHETGLDFDGVRYAIGGDVFEGRLEATSDGDRLKDLCDPSVNQEAGYYHVTGTRDLNMFYWFFESRGDPETDPVILWMTGGPGCSDATALFAENGPCLLDGGRSEPRINEYSWNERASVIYIDQPCGVGYSFGDAADEDKNEKGVAKHVGGFLLDFFEKHENLKVRPRPPSLSPSTAILILTHTLSPSPSPSLSLSHVFATKRISPSTSSERATEATTCQRSRAPSWTTSTSRAWASAMD